MSISITYIDATNIIGIQLIRNNLIGPESGINSLLILFSIFPSDSITIGKEEKLFSTCIHFNALFESRDKTRIILLNREEPAFLLIVRATWFSLQKSAGFVDLW